MQYLYWEKVQPLEGECAFNPSLSMEPLMRNWTEAAASRRDKFDYDHGRGRGNIKVIHYVGYFLNLLYNIISCINIFIDHIYLYLTCRLKTT
jgi:hypothetical protein